MAALVSGDSLYTPRNFLGWLGFSLAAGNVNAIAFLGAERFVTHLSGAGTKLGLDIGQWEVALESVLILGTFVLGATVSALLIEGPRHRGNRPRYLLPLGLTSGLLTVGGLLGGVGVFGAFGGGPDAPNFLLLYLLSFAMGLQNAAVSINTGLAVRTTHLTGPATDLGIHLTGALLAEGPAARTARRGVWLRAAQVATFIVGAALAVPLCNSAGFFALLFPAVLVMASTWVTFAKVARQVVGT
jgi:uncharacterized membrane protein YoaK (UPF0700 family)